MNRILELVRDKFLKDKLIRSIIKNSGIIFIGNTIASGINLISFTIMAKQLGPTSLALFVLVQTYTLILNDIFNVQTWESMVKFGADLTNKEKIAKTIKINTIIDVIGAMIAFFFALLLIQPVVRILKWDPSIIYMGSLYIFSILFRLTSLTIGIPRLFNKFLMLACVQVCAAIGKIGLIIYVMFFANELIYYVIVYLVIEILANTSIIIYSLLMLNKHLGKDWWKNSSKIELNQIKFIWWTNLRTIIRIPVRYFDMIVISTVMPLKTVGIYKVYKEIAGILDRFSDPINQAIFPEFTKLIGKNNIRMSLTTTKKSMMLLCGASAAITIPLIIASKLFIGMIFGNQYLELLPALYFLLALVGISFILVPINSLFVAAGFAKMGFYIVVITNTAYLLSAFYFGKHIGIYGVVAAYGIQMVMNQGLKLYLMRKYSSGWNNIIR